MEAGCHTAGGPSLLANLHDTIDMIAGIGPSTLLPAPPGRGFHGGGGGHNHGAHLAVPVPAAAALAPAPAAVVSQIGTGPAVPTPGPGSVAGSLAGDSIMGNPGHPVHAVNPAMARFGGYKTPSLPPAPKPWGLIIGGTLLGVVIIGCVVAIFVVRHRNRKQEEKQALARAEAERQRALATQNALQQQQQQQQLQLQQQQAAAASAPTPQQQQHVRPVQPQSQPPPQQPRPVQQASRPQFTAVPPHLGAPIPVPVVLTVTGRPGVSEAVQDFDRQYGQRHAPRIEIVEDEPAAPAPGPAPAAAAAPAAAPAAGSVAGPAPSRPNAVINPDPGLLHVAEDVARVIAVQDTYAGHTKELQRDEATLLQTSAAITPSPPLDAPVLTDSHHQALLASAAPADGSHPAGQHPV